MQDEEVDETNDLATFNNFNNDRRRKSGRERQRTLSTTGKSQKKIQKNEDDYDYDNEIMDRLSSKLKKNLDSEMDFEIEPEQDLWIGNEEDQIESHDSYDRSRTRSEKKHNKKATKKTQKAPVKYNDYDNEDYDF